MVRKKVKNTMMHPFLDMLAHMLGVPFEELAAWYRQGYDALTILRFYRIAEATQLSPDEIAAQYISGMTWRDILKHNLKPLPNGLRGYVISARAKSNVR
jgi:hypothetical protein